jgi:hypothetical protein
MTGLSMEECVAVGGHCWGGDLALVGADGVREVNQMCQRCGASRQGMAQEPHAWIYPPGQP